MENIQNIKREHATQILGILLFLFSSAENYQQVHPIFFGFHPY